MKSRIVQLLAKPIAMALASLAGWLGATGDGTADLALALASAVVAIGAWVLDLAIHRVETGGVSKPAGTKKLIIPLAMCLTLTGCTGVPGQIIVHHADLAGGDHLRRVEADPDATDAERETWRAHWQAIRDAGESAQ